MFPGFSDPNYCVITGPSDFVTTTLSNSEPRIVIAYERLYKSKVEIITMDKRDVKNIFLAEDSIVFYNGTRKIGILDKNYMKNKKNFKKIVKLVKREFSVSKIF